MSGRPWVLLDVDGVVNLGLFLSSAERGRLHGRDGWYSGRAGEPHDYWATRIVLNRAWGPMIREIAAAGAELAWATRWRDAANMWISPLLGLPELPVVPVSSDDRQLKAWAAVDFTQGRPWAWLEDQDEELAMASALCRGREFLPAQTGPKTGLTREHADKVIAWLGTL